jgi:Holliday junction resolvase RusA-like endonuclease
MTTLYTATIHGAPRTKKNSQQILINQKTRRPFVMPSKAYKEYEALCLSQLRKKETPISSPVNVECVYYMPTRRKVDLCNLLEATSDILVRAGVLADDNSDIVVSHDGSRVLYDKNYPRTEITITEATE